MAWYTILFLVIGFSLGLFFLIYGLVGGIADIRYSHSLKKLEASRYVFHHIASAPVKETKVLLLANLPTIEESKKEK